MEPSQNLCQCKSNQIKREVEWIQRSGDVVRRTKKNFFFLFSARRRRDGGEFIHVESILCSYQRFKSDSVQRRSPHQNRNSYTGIFRLFNYSTMMRSMRIDFIIVTRLPAIFYGGWKIVYGDIEEIWRESER